MDIAAMSVVMANNQLRSSSSLAVMGNVKDLMQQQGKQLTDMLQQSVPQAPHSSLGTSIDLKA